VCSYEDDLAFDVSTASREDGRAASAIVLQRTSACWKIETASRDRAGLVIIVAMIVANHLLTTSESDPYIPSISHRLDNHRIG
jgi:hypothetical protein